MKLSRARSVLLACVLAGSFVAVAAPAQAASTIKIHRVFFDSPGSDTNSNTSRNAEFVTLKNTGSSSRSLTGWTLRDTSNHVYRFGSYRLGAGKYVTIHTGDGSNSQRHRYWGSGAYIWNNTGDTARLRRPDGTQVDSCQWSGAGSSRYC